MFQDIVVRYYGIQTYDILKFVFYLSPIWLPILLGVLFWVVWVQYVRFLAFSNQKYALLEIRLPRDIARTPVAMELVMGVLHQMSGEGNFIDRYWSGKTRAWFSLEIVSDGGTIRFLIWTREEMKNFVETQIYSQFPEVEIHEVPDYITNVSYDSAKNDMAATRFELTQPSPLPIKSYLDFELDKADVDEEFKIDPIAPMLEFMGSLKQGEHIWLQIVVRAHKKEKRSGVFSKPEDWTGEIDKVRADFLKGVKDSGQRSSREEQRILDALNRRAQKLAFDCGIRCVYFADTKEVFNKGNASSIQAILKPFSASLPSNIKEGKRYYAGYNSFKTDGGTTKDIDYSWQDYKGAKVNRRKRKSLDAFKRRMFFYPPYHQKTFILTTEELATLFHFPGAAVTTPGLARIPSKRAQAPTNLPV